MYKEIAANGLLGIWQALKPRGHFDAGWLALGQRFAEVFTEFPKIGEQRIYISDCNRSQTIARRRCLKS